MRAGPLSERDYELISAYLDGEVSGGQKQAVELRLKQDAQFMRAYEQLSQVRRLLRSQPRLRAPRNYVLSPESASLLQSSPRALPLLPKIRWVLAFGSVFFLVLFVWNWLLLDRSSLLPLKGGEVFSQSDLVQSVSSESVPGEALPMAKADLPTPSSIYPPSPGRGEMGGGSGMPGIAEAPLLVPYTGTLWVAPTAIAPAPQGAPQAPLEDSASEESNNGSALSLPGDRPPVGVEEVTVRAWRQGWVVRQIVYGVLAVSFALLAIRFWRRRG